MTDIDDYALNMLKKLKHPDSYPARDSDQAFARRIQFIDQVKSAAHTIIQPDRRITPPQSWMGRWAAKLFPSRPKPRFSPMGILAMIVLVSAVLLAGAGITVAAAQTSGPQDSLYPLKLASEDFRLRLSANPMFKFDLLLQFTDRRIDEIVGLIRSGEQIPEQVAIRFQEQSQLLFQLAATVDDPNLVRALDRLQIHLHLHVQQISLAAQREAKDLDLIYPGLQGFLVQQLDLVGLGLQNPKAFRQQIRQGNYFPSTLPPQPPNMTPGSGFGSSGDFETPHCENCTPVPGDTQMGPGTAIQGATSMPQEGHGQESGSTGTPACEQCGAQPDQEHQSSGGGSHATPGGNQGDPGGTNHP